MRRALTGAGRGTLRRLLGGIAVGALAGWAVVGLDAWVTFELPGALTYVPANARVLLGGVIGGLISLAGFMYFMRAIVVQLVSTEVSPRVISAFLEDRFQENLLAFMAGGTAFAGIALAAVPADDAAGRTPQLAVVTALLFALTALLGLLYTMRASVRSLHVGELIRRISDRALALLPEDRHAPARGPEPSAEPQRAIVAAESGWVARVEHETIAELLDDEATVAIDVQEGEFVTAGSEIGRVWCSDRSAARLAEEVARCVPTSRTRDGVAAVSTHIDQLVDIAERAMGYATVDSATVREVVAHLGWLLARAFEIDEGPVLDAVPRVVVPRWRTGEQTVRDAFDRLRVLGAQYPAVASAVITTLAEVADRVCDDERAAAAVRALARETVEDAKVKISRTADAAPIVELARSRGLIEAETDQPDR